MWNSPTLVILATLLREELTPAAQNSLSGVWPACQHPRLYRRHLMENVLQHDSDLSVGRNSCDSGFLFYTFSFTSCFLKLKLLLKKLQVKGLLLFLKPKLSEQIYKICRFLHVYIYGYGSQIRSFV